MKKDNDHPLVYIYLFFCMGLIIFFAFNVFSCKSAPKTDSQIPLMPLFSPPVPAAPVMEPVRFEAAEGGLWLSYNDYRALERNIIAMREYSSRLEIIIKFYRGE